MEYNEEEKYLLNWIDNHYMENKDELLEQEEKNFSQSKSKRERKKYRSPAAWEVPLPEDEIDLHGYTAEDAALAVEQRIEDMQIAGLKILRIIHGGGNPSYGNVKRIIDRKVHSVWKNRVSFYETEPDNPGSSILKIKPLNNSKKSPKKK